METVFGMNELPRSKLRGIEPSEINQDYTRIFHGLSGGIEKGDLDNRSLLGKPYLALAGT